ncbi:MAG: hypothetical protein ACRDKB_05370 [Actinomycetota bacterium]
MAIDERSRHALYTRLQVLGEEHATVLIEHLPPVGWADVATKQDLRELEARLDLRFEATEQRILATLYSVIDRQTRVIFLGLPAAFAAMTGVVVGVAQLI